MPYETGFTVLREFASTGTDAAPTASSTFVTPQFAPSQDSVEVAFGEITKGASDTATVELWLHTYTDGGEEAVILYDDLATISGSTTSVTLDRVRLENVPAGSFYARLADASASTEVTGTVYVRSYQADD